MNGSTNEIKFTDMWANPIRTGKLYGLALLGHVSKILGYHEDHHAVGSNDLTNL